MYCSRCGTKIHDGVKFCNKCGFNISSIINNPPPLNTNNINQNGNNLESSNKKMIIMGAGIGTVVVLIILLFVIIIQKSSSNYYFSDNSYANTAEATTDNQTSENTSTTKSKNKSIIVWDNVYEGVSISSVSDVDELITKDSIEQKVNCPSEILQIENEIIEKYNITAVNLCEMDVDFARELENVFEVIYEEYPVARGYITNLSLRNTTSMSDKGVIAAFMPAFTFATSNSETTYPWAFKTQVLLSSSFFLNKSKLEKSVNDSSAAGHFPPNSNIYSPVAHELGHYLSFLAMMHSHYMDSVLLINGNNVESFYAIINDFKNDIYSLKILKEAYDNYKNDNANTTIEFDDWRGTISGYALAKDNSGNYIYDETIAEAFHDVYLNKDNAKDASKYIIAVLKKNLENR